MNYVSSLTEELNGHFLYINTDNVDGSLSSLDIVNEYAREVYTDLVSQVLLYVGMNYQIPCIFRVLLLSKRILYLETQT